MNATFSVQLNPANPAEFFGACGLLELSSRRSAANGWFDAKDVFHLSTKTKADGDPVSAALHMLKTAGSALPKTEEEKDLMLAFGDVGGAALFVRRSVKENASPLVIGDPVNIRLDWWQSHKSLKTFAGRQESAKIYGNLLYEASTNLSKRKVCKNLWSAESKGVKGLGLDAYRSWTQRSMGFSQDKMPTDQQSPPCRPAIELLAMIGLQRMRPLTDTNPNGIEYWTWDMPLSAPVAGAAVEGQMEFAKLRKYRANCQMNGKNKNYKIAEQSD